MIEHTTLLIAHSLIDIQFRIKSNAPIGNLVTCEIKRNIFNSEKRFWSINLKLPEKFMIIFFQE